MSEPLMIAVERIVRPVVAPTERKLRMRQELYDHLQSIHAEERALGGNESDVLRRSVARLGDPDDLTAELSASLSWPERYEARINRWLEPRPGETPLNCAFRIGLILFVVTTLSFLLAIVIRSTVDVRRPFPFVGATALMLLLTIDSFLIAVLAIHTSRAVLPPACFALRLPRVWLGAVSSGFVVALSGLATHAAVSRQLDWSTHVWRQWLLTGGAAVLIFVVAQALFQWERRRVHPWLSLELGATE